MSSGWAKDIETYLTQRFGMTSSAAGVFMMLWRATRSIRGGKMTIKHPDFIEFADAWAVWQRSTQ